jgi:hypothetical protein
MFGFHYHEKIIHDLIILSQTTDLRQGNFSLTLSEQNRPGVSISLSIHVTPPAALPGAAAHSFADPGLETESPPPAIRRYVTSAYFLEQCRTRLFEGSPTTERQFLLSGIPRGENAYDLGLLIPVKLVNASASGVEADLADLFATLHKLDKSYGLLLLGIIHSHLWTGRSAVNPSETDRKLQKTLEESGYPTVQAIFSQDAYCGFFTNTVPFTVQIAGKGYEEVETHETQTVVKLNHILQLSDQAVQTETSTGTPVLRPPAAHSRV